MDWLKKLTEDEGPICWWGRLPVYASTLLVSLQTFVMAIIAISIPLGWSWLPPSLSFSTAEVLGNYRVWQFITYPLVATPSLLFLLQMAMLWFFGTETEKAIGRRAFLKLYAWLVLLPPLVLLIPAVAGYHSLLIGSESPNFCVFLSFAIIYPSAQMLFGITAKWFAVGLFALNSLQLISLSSWTELFTFWLNVGTVIFFLHKQGIKGTYPFFAVFKAFKRGFFNPPSYHPTSTSTLPQKTITPTSQKKDTLVKKNNTNESEPDPVDSIDHILDKIARHGMASLTKAEREHLQRARQALLERERKR
ncbi:MAG: rhomboid family intramembrane serine protease [Chthoniobacterales bacterium]|nr:rhomboid family intramembrane serine protease [Chthoniobacterales bacterium]